MKKRLPLIMLIYLIVSVNLIKLPVFADRLIEASLINPAGRVIGERIKLPKDYHRVSVEKNSFADYLRNLPLKSASSRVKYYNGVEKINHIYVAVVDLDVGNHDLQQCADAVIRLRAEYLYQRGLYQAIHFNFTNGFRADYTRWMDGYRIQINGNQTNWRKQAARSNTYQDFRKYLNLVFTYAGTRSLAQELKSVPYAKMAIGDLLIQGGSPGHAVIVVDMAVNQATGEKLYLLAQSYMPAQDIHLLKNLQAQSLSPWYSLRERMGTIDTPEWQFYTSDLKRFFSH